MKKTLVSIIIPVKAINDYIKESIPRILKLNYDNFEILIFPDEEDTKHKWEKTTIIPSGKVGPAEKRDLALKYAQGDILAFLDDDAYPKADWLKFALKPFSDKAVAAVGGPAITPQNDGVLQKVSGAVFESYTGGAAARNRYLPIGQQKQVDDWPTVNLLVRKDVFQKVGGFDNTYWPGEDTKLCLDILNAGYRIVYEPKAVVYHHRRSDLLKHFKQIGNYALHRGHFAKIYPQTSRKLFYFVPSLFDLYFLGFALLLLIHNSLFTILYSLPLAVYCLLLIADSLIISFRWRNPMVGLLTIPMILLTHFWYGVRFVQGLIVGKLVR